MEPQYSGARIEGDVVTLDFVKKMMGDFKNQKCYSKLWTLSVSQFLAVDIDNNSCVSKYWCEEFYDAYEDDVNVYEVMELCKGGELLDKIILVSEGQKNRLSSLVAILCLTRAPSHHSPTAPAWEEPHRLSVAAAAATSHGFSIRHPAMTNQELIDNGNRMMDETDQAIDRSKKVVHDTINVGTDRQQL
ncbi:putative plant SNARE 11 [Camellia lanceoleosa]|uniref:Plant SNARE 11 n=1 Tax=Camellia lanceoleosa TaxID=1840588 RepID=A0ACC0H0W6_9ERIC|nr:putative plant SNARE 11 [Camellia lanceoleosa]